MTISPVLYSSRSEEWATPQAFFNKLDAEFHFNLDAAATAENTKCQFYLSLDGENALLTRWVQGTRGTRIFCNPPYGKEIGAWFAKAREAQADGALVVMLAHARTDTKWWHTHVQGVASEVRFIKGRLKFGDGKQSAPFPSAVIIYRPSEQLPLPAQGEPQSVETPLSTTVEPEE